ncbi:MAG: type II secretion system protein GspC [Deltaproteobacteria bacterium]
MFLFSGSRHKEFGMANPLTGVTVQAFLHRFFPAAYLVLVALLGSVAGWLAIIILGFGIVPPAEKVPVSAPSEKEAALTTPLDDYQIILDRDIFDPEGAGTAKLSGKQATVPASEASTSPAEEKKKTKAVLPKNLALIGTLTAGANSLAVMREGKETHVYSLGDEVADGISVAEISRNTVVFAFSDGSRQTLSIDEDQAQLAIQTAPAPKVAASAHQSASAIQAEIKKVGENRYIIPRDVAEQARNNVGELMKQARMEPHLVDGQTDGFVVRMIRPRSFLGQLGLRLGDVVTAINDVQLNSPEKALQIFQQLREARNIKVDLLRKNKPLTLEFETD